MLVSEEQLDYFRHILIDLEVTYAAVIGNDGKLAEVVHVSELQSSDIVKFEYKVNYLQITVNPNNKEVFHYHNDPQNPELIFAQPFDFLVTENFCIVFLPTNHLDLESSVILKASFEVGTERIECLPLKDRTPAEIIAFLKGDGKRRSHDIRIHDQKFSNSFLALEEYICECTVEQKMELISNVHSFSSHDELKLAVSNAAYLLDLPQVSLDLSMSINPESDFYARSLLQSLESLPLPENFENILLVINSSKLSESTKDLSLVLNHVFKLLSFSLIQDDFLNPHFIVLYNKWRMNWTEKSEDIYYQFLSDEKLRIFFEKEFPPEASSTISLALNCLVSEYLNLHTPPTKKPPLLEAMKSNAMTTIFRRDYIIQKEIEKVLGKETKEFENLLMHIDLKFICGKPLDGYKGYKNRQEYFEAMSEEFAEQLSKPKKI